MALALASNLQPSEEHLSILAKYFGHSRFKPLQWEIIRSILYEKRDHCAVMSTGYGKSLCYQYPSVFCRGLTIVVSPLISLMQDQVLSLKASNIPANYLGSAHSSKSKQEIMTDLLDGKYRLIYVTPEWSTTDFGLETIKQLQSIYRITLIAIDEAHCVSQWGFDFRETYRKLYKLREILPDIPVLAVTATATRLIRNDICISLKLKNPLISCTSMDRPNLYFSVKRKCVSKAEESFKDFRRILHRDGLIYKFQGATIIYCSTRKRTDVVAEVLNNRGIQCAAYHAGLDQEKRKEIHDQFVRNAVSVIVATIAFGMGINKPDVRCVIHYDAPKDIESYYQEVGRAGRDGLPSTCYIFYLPQDFNVHRFLNRSRSDKPEIREKHLRTFLETVHCRRRLLLQYFEETAVSNSNGINSDCCDNCNKSSLEQKESPPINIVREIKLLLEAIDFFKGRFGMMIPVKFLRGSNDRRIWNDCKTSRLYGSGKDISEEAWKALGTLCLNENLLDEKRLASKFQVSSSAKPFGSTVYVTPLGKKYLESDNNTDIVLNLTQDVIKFFGRKTNETKKPALAVNFWQNIVDKYTLNKKQMVHEENQAKLLSLLKRFRDELALADDVPPNNVASDPMCFKMCVEMPRNKNELARINGFNEAMIEKYGDRFIEKIIQFSNNENLSETDLDNTSDVNGYSDALLTRALNEKAAEYGEIPISQYTFNDDSYRHELNDIREEFFENIGFGQTDSGNHDLDDGQDELFENIGFDQANSSSHDLEDGQDELFENISFDQANTSCSSRDLEDGQDELFEKIALDQADNSSHDLDDGQDELFERVTLNKRDSDSNDLDNFLKDTVFDNIGAMNVENSSAKLASQSNLANRTSSFNICNEKLPNEIRTSFQSSGVAELENRSSNIESVGVKDNVVSSLVNISPSTAKRKRTLEFTCETVDDSTNNNDLVQKSSSSLCSGSAYKSLMRKKMKNNSLFKI